MVNTVMFDFDGTLMNTNGLIVKCFQHTYRTFEGRERDPAEIMKTFGEPLAVTMEKQFGPARKQEAVDVYRSFHRERFARLIELFPGMELAVKQLKQEGYKTALVTSRLKDTTFIGLHKYDLVSWFDCITTMDQLTRHKPDPEAIEITLEQLGSSAEEAVMIGDSRFDMLCAKNAGCKSVLVDWTVIGEDERRQIPSDYVAKDAEDLMRIIREI